MGSDVVEKFFVDIESSDVYFRCGNHNLAVMRYVNEYIQPGETVKMFVRWDLKKGKIQNFEKKNITLLVRPYILGDELDPSVVVFSIGKGKDKKTGNPPTGYLGPDGTLVIHNPSAPDRGTIFKPDNPQDYFNQNFPGN